MANKQQDETQYSPSPRIGLSSLLPVAIRYKLICVPDNQQQFEDEVNAALADGWQLQGGASITAYESAGVNDAGQYTPSYSSSTWAYAQAMVKAIYNANEVTT